MNDKNENRWPAILPNWPDIKVILEFPSDYEGLYPVTKMTEVMLQKFEDNEPKSRDKSIVIRPFAYFNLDGEYDGDNPPVLKVRYTRSAWGASAKAGGGRPRIFTRKFIIETKAWAEYWDEIEDTTDYYDGTYYYLQANLPDIPDPAIGGC